jgi:hypothetical protein
VRFPEFIRARLLAAAAALVAGGAVAGAAPAVETDTPGDLQLGVVLDAAEQSGSATATVRIHAPRDTVWSLITSCAEALKLVPGLVGCDVLETAPDSSWQRIRHVLDYSWYVPKLTYDIRATYDKPARVVVERIAGDLKSLQVSWTLQSDGDDTVAHYRVDLAPGFWVPRWLVRGALRRDLPKMLLALRARAEAVQHH